MTVMPVLFVGHGSPMNIIEKNRFTTGWKEIAEAIPRPKAILCVSAHLYVSGNVVTGAEQPGTIHDFYGFPEELYQVEYPASGSPELAERVAALVPNTNIDAERGLDHGAWSVLHFMYPDAAIPVAQLSVNSNNTPLESFQIGHGLRPLREQGILVIGSGNVVHNLRLVDWDMEEDGFGWADDFDAYIKTSILEGRYGDVIRYERAGSSAVRAFAYRDHYDPLLYSLGAADAGEPVKVYNDARVLGSLSMTSYLFG